jgi:hypothetical protein
LISAKRRKVAEWLKETGIWPMTPIAWPVLWKGLRGSVPILVDKATGWGTQKCARAGLRNSMLGPRLITK